MNPEPVTLVEMLRRRAELEPEKLAFTFLEQGEEEAGQIKYGELERRARSIGAYLQETPKPGERVVLLFPSGPDFVAAFFGCFYAQVVPIPANPPRLNRPALRLQAIVSDARPSLAFTTRDYLTDISQRFEQMPELKTMRWIAIEDIDASAASAWKPTDLAEGDVAFLQYTSGSTATPKGMTITHKNALHNQRMQVELRRYITTPLTTFVNWVPIFHDMGLMTGVIQTIYAGTPCYMLTPVAFLQKPLRWLNAMTRYKATISGAPNFAYDLCVDSISPEEREGLDLSNWKMAFNSAEPIRIETMRRFVDTYKSYGFQMESFLPGYGLAEATLMVTGVGGRKEPRFYSAKRSALEENKVVPAEAGDKDRMDIVSTGPATLDARVIIVNPETSELAPPEEVGEIWVSGGSVAAGYWNRPEESARAFEAYLKDTGEGPFLRTGDFGFMQDGELFVTGRLKDMIIVKGRNYYPQDVEASIEKSHAALQPGGGAAFALEGEGVERLVVVQEVKREVRKSLNEKEVVDAIRMAVARDTGIRASAVVLIKPFSIPKTSSGKIMRHAVKEQFLNNQLDVVAEWKAPIKELAK